MAEAARHGGNVDGGVTAADHHHTPADMLQTPVVEGFQESGRGHHVRRFGIGDRQRASGLRTHAEKHRIKVLADLFQRDVLTHMTVHARLHPQVEDALNLRVQHVARGTETRDAVAHHASEEFVLIENRHFMTLQHELIGA